ncbi:aldehyde reductase [Algiphilus sp.]|uniref:SDR family oxidoreductase n=1 Tax=Algiphilus sp. TaxID=1872431 RepID=UPI002A677421|nr:aldehyde reductase [Pseudomonadota bacterium]
MTTIDAKAPVCVTGASGYIAGWIVRYLLEAGHTVHATVRDPSKQSSVGHLQAIAEAQPGTLKLFAADLNQPGSFDEAVQGCQVVMHTASPFVLSGYDDAEAALVRPAVDGTRNVLEAVNRCADVQRVVLTSSVAGIYGDSADIRNTENGVFTEADWNTTSSVDHNPYQYSKVAAERVAWEICKAQSRWDMVTINPAMVLGPSLTNASQSASIDLLRQLADGRLHDGVPRLSMGIVDVREVARAHLLAAFTPEAEGRYILCSASRTMLQMATTLKSRFRDGYRFPKRELPKPLVWLFGPMKGPVTRRFISRNAGYDIRFDNSRSRQLGVVYRTPEETLVEHFQQIIDDGQIRSRKAA